MSRCSLPAVRRRGPARRHGSSPSPARPRPSRRRPEPEQQPEDATRAVPAADRWAEEKPARRPRPAPVQEDEEDEEDDRDPIAENIIRWVPPVTALICAGIALYGFIYYQFFI